MENWKQILGLKVVDDSIIHLVSDRGRVLTINNGRATFRLGSTDRNGYLVLTFGHTDHRLVHRLVGEYFCDKKEGSGCINHKNGIKTDNRSVNLEWVTYAENNRHAYATGLNTCYSENHHGAIDKEIVYKIYELKKEGKRLHEVAKLIDVNYGTLKHIYHGKNWRYEYEQFFGEKFKKSGRGGAVCWNAMPKEMVINIYERKKAGARAVEIAKELNLNYGTVKDICNGKNWRHLYKEHFGVL